MHDAEKPGHRSPFDIPTIYLEEKSVETDGSGYVKFDLDERISRNLPETVIPIRGFQGLDLWLNPSGGESVQIETAPTPDGPWDALADRENITGALQRIFCGNLGKHFLRFKSTADGGDLRAFITPGPAKGRPFDADAVSTTNLKDEGNSGDTLELELDLDPGEKIIYLAESDGDYLVEIEHHRLGETITQDVSGGTVTGTNVDGDVVFTSGHTATVRIQDKTSDGSDASATLIAKVV